MILPIGATLPDTGYAFPNLYGLGYGFGARVVSRESSATVPPARREVRDTVSLSPAAQRIFDQAQRLKQMQRNLKE